MKIIGRESLIGYIEALFMDIRTGAEFDINDIIEDLIKYVMDLLLEEGVKID